MDDFRFNEVTKELNDKKEKTTSKDVVLNFLSAVAFYFVVVICNVFMSQNGQIKVEWNDLLNWNIGLLTIVNWVGGIVITYCTRQSGINRAKLTEKYVKSDEEKDAAIEGIKDIAAAQKALDEKILADFEARKEACRKFIENVLQKDVKSYSVGDKLPKGTPFKIRIMAYRLKRMVPPEISLVELSVSNGAGYRQKGLYNLIEEPDKTGAKWFITKAGGKIGWFAIAPIVMSLVTSSLVFGVNWQGVVTVLGTLAIMVFNAFKSYSTAFYAVKTKGVARNKQIVRIVESLQ